MDSPAPQPPAPPDARAFDRRYRLEVIVTATTASNCCGSAPSSGRCSRDRERGQDHDASSQLTLASLARCRPGGWRRGRQAGPGGCRSSRPPSPLRRWRRAARSGIQPGGAPLATGQEPWILAVMAIGPSWVCTRVRVPRHCGSLGPGARRRQWLRSGACPGGVPPLALLLLWDQAKLLQGGHPVVDADLLGDQPVLDL